MVAGCDPEIYNSKVRKDINNVLMNFQIKLKSLKTYLCQYMIMYCKIHQKLIKKPIRGRIASVSECLKIKVNYKTGDHSTSSATLLEARI